MVRSLTKTCWWPSESAPCPNASATVDEPLRKRLTESSGREELIRIPVLVTFLVISGLSNAQAPATTSAQTLEPLDASGEITYFIATGAPESRFRPSDTDLVALALQAWARSTEGKLRFSPAPESSAVLRVYWVAADFGQYGEMRPIVVDGRRGAAVYIRPDTEALGAEIAIRSREDSLFRDTVVYLTCLHELGHALGLEHTAEFADIMYFFGFGGDIVAFFERYRSQLRSREDIAGVAGLSEGDLAQLRSLYSVR